MQVMTLIISIIALIMAILVYRRVGGVADFKKQTETLSHVGDSIATATDSLRDKTPDVIDKMEAVVRGKEEPKQAPAARKAKQGQK